MKSRIGMLLALALILVFAGCSRQDEQGAPQEAQESAVQREAVESKEEAPPEEAAKAGEEDPDVRSCLQLVGQGKFEDALPVCLDALKNHPANEELKEAVETAKEGVGDAAAGVTEEAERAQEEAEGALGEVGGMAP